MNNLLCHNFYLPLDCRCLLRALAFGLCLDQPRISSSRRSVLVAVELDLSPGVFAEQIRSPA